MVGFRTSAHKTSRRQLPSSCADPSDLCKCGLGFTCGPKTYLFKELYIETYLFKELYIETYLCKELYIETIIRNHKEARSFRLQVRGFCLGVEGRGEELKTFGPEGDTI